MKWVKTSWTVDPKFACLPAYEGVPDDDVTLRVLVANGNAGPYIAVHTLTVHILLKRQNY